MQQVLEDEPPSATEEDYDMECIVSNLQTKKIHIYHTLFLSMRIKVTRKREKLILEIVGKVTVTTVCKIHVKHHY